MHQAIHVDNNQWIPDQVQSFIHQCLIISYDKIGLNLTFERAFVLVLRHISYDTF